MRTPNITIKTTAQPTIVKFELPDVMVAGSYEFKNIDEANASPLAQKLFYLPFVKTVYLSANFIAIERFSIVEWADVQDEVAAQIAEYLEQGLPLLLDSAVKKAVPISVYGETTPNPNTMKFVANKALTPVSVHFANLDEAGPSELAKALFTFHYVKEVFLAENYVSVTKYEAVTWDEVSAELRQFVKQFLENGGQAIDVSALPEAQPQPDATPVDHKPMDATSEQIIALLDEYVKPAVTADGGNIQFDSFDPESKRVKVVLQGSCNGCPSSTITLKSGIENLLKDMLQEPQLTVEALNG